MIEIRASRAPLAFACPGSIRPASIALSAEGTASRVGTATHAALQVLAESGSIDWDGIPELAARHDVNPEEVRILCGMASKLWPTLSPSFPGALTEVYLSADRQATDGTQYALTGHADILSISGTVARVGDWKTGRHDANYAQQMRAYAALALLDDHTLTEATATVIWIRDGEIENYTMKREALRPWLSELEERVVAWDGVFHPGGHCDGQFCPRSHECEASKALVRRDVAAISSRELVARAEAELATMAPDELIELHRKADLVKRYAERIDDAIRLHVLEHGAVKGTQGTMLTIDASVRREINPVAAWPVLEAAGFVDEDFAECMDLRISRVEKRVAEKAGRGNGAAAIRELKSKLDEAKAVSTRETYHLKERRT